MTRTPTKDHSEKEIKKRKDEGDNIFLDILYNLVVQVPVFVVGWIISKIDWN